MSDARIIHVKIGEAKIGKDGDVLYAILGSCIGIGLLWKDRGLFGLAHCLLPESPCRLYSISARFASHAVPSLIALLKAQSSDLSQLEAIVVGGGNMTATEEFPDSEKRVGAMNAQAALHALAAAGIRVIYQDIGGAEGRRITIDCSTGTYESRRIPRIAA